MPSEEQLREFHRSLPEPDWSAPPRGAGVIPDDHKIAAKFDEPFKADRQGYQSWRDSFISQVHLAGGVSFHLKITKLFGALKKASESEKALAPIRMITTHTAANYRDIVTLLENTFGGAEEMISLHRSNISNHVNVKSTDTARVSSLLATLKAYQNSLRAIGRGREAETIALLQDVSGTLERKSLEEFVAWQQQNCKGKPTLQEFTEWLDRMVERGNRARGLLKESPKATVQLATTIAPHTAQPAAPLPKPRQGRKPPPCPICPNEKHYFFSFSHSSIFQAIRKLFTMVHHNHYHHRRLTTNIKCHNDCARTFIITSF